MSAPDDVRVEVLGGDGSDEEKGGPAVQRRASLLERRAKRRFDHTRNDRAPATDALFALLYAVRVARTRPVNAAYAILEGWRAPLVAKAFPFRARARDSLEEPEAELEAGGGGGGSACTPWAVPLALFVCCVWAPLMAALLALSTIALFAIVQPLSLLILLLGVPAAVMADLCRSEGAVPLRRGRYELNLHPNSVVQRQWLLELFGLALLFALSSAVTIGEFWHERESLLAIEALLYVALSINTSMYFVTVHSAMEELESDAAAQEDAAGRVRVLHSLSQELLAAKSLEDKEELIAQLQERLQEQPAQDDDGGAPLKVLRTRTMLVQHVSAVQRAVDDEILTRVFRSGVCGRLLSPLASVVGVVVSVFTLFTYLAFESVSLTMYKSTELGVYYLNACVALTVVWVEIRVVPLWVIWVGVLALAAAILVLNLFDAEVAFQFNVNVLPDAVPDLKDIARLAHEDDDAPKAAAAMEKAALLLRRKGGTPSDLYGLPPLLEGMGQVFFRLSQVDISGVGLTNEDVAGLVEVLEDAPHVTELLLEDNFIADDGAGALAGVLQGGRSRIEFLSLRANQVGVRGAHALGRAVHGQGTALRKLDVSYNVLGVEGVKVLAKAMVASPHDQLLLKVYGVDIGGDDGGKEARDALQQLLLKPGCRAFANKPKPALGPGHTEMKNTAIKPQAASKEAMRRSREIDRWLGQEERAFEERMRVLLLGFGDSGKSTLWKQLHLLYQIVDAQRGDEQVSAVHAKVLSLMSTALDVAEQIGVFENEEGKRTRALIAESPERLTPAAAESFKAFLERKEVQSAALHRRVAEEVPMTGWDDVDHFFRRLPLIASPSFQPTPEDVHRARGRLAMTGVVEGTFKRDGSTFTFVDVGGQRNERRKWMHQFDIMTAVICCVNISEFDEVLYEDGRTNRLVEAVSVLEEQSIWFRRTPIIVFLTKISEFRERAQTVSLQVCPLFEDYDRADDPLEFVCVTIRKRLQDGRYYRRTNVYVSPVELYDTSNVRINLDMAFDIMIRRSLQEGGLLLD